MQQQRMNLSWFSNLHVHVHALYILGFHKIGTCTLKNDNQHALSVNYYVHYFSLLATSSKIIHEQFKCMHI